MRRHFWLHAALLRSGAPDCSAGRFHRWLSAFLIAVLVVSLEVGAVSPAAAEQPQPPAQAQVDEAADIPSARATARLRNKRVEALSERTESTSTWVNPDGTRTTELNAGPVRVRRGDTWVPVDLTLVKNADGAIRPAAHPRDLAIAGGGAADQARDLASVTAADGQVALQWTGPLPEPVLAGDTATYPEIQPGIDLQVKATRTGFQQFLILKRKPNKPVSFTMPLRADGVSLRTDADGNTDVVDKTGATVGSVPAAQMWDARVDGQTGLLAKPAKVKQRKDAKPKVKTAQGKDRETVDITVEPADGYLDDPNVKYPVTIDPGATIWANFDTFTQSNITNSDQSGMGELRLGTYDGGTTKARSYLHFDMSQFRGTTILESKLWLYATHSWSCGARNWQIWSTPLVGTGTRWSNQPAPWTHWATSGATRGYSTSCDDGWIATDILGLQQAWSKEGFTNAGVMLKAENEGDSYGWKKFSSAEGGAVPHVDVTYNTQPSPATGLTVSDRGDNGGVVYTRSLTPTLSYPVHDPDGDVLYPTFYVYEGDSLIATHSVGGVNSGGVATWKLPEGLLQNGKSYRYRASAHDNRIWAGDGYVSIRNKMGGRAVDIPGCATAAGTTLQIWDYWGGGCQRWNMTHHGGTTFAFGGRDAGHAIDVANCATDNGSSVQIWWYGSTNVCQQFNLENVGNGEYKIRGKHSGKPLDPIGCTGDNGSRLVIWDAYAADCQVWRLDVAPDPGVTVQWRDFTVDTSAPGAPFVSSSDYPSDNGWHKAANQAGTFTFTPPSGATDVAGYVYGLDVTPATEVAAGADGKAAPSITPTTDGQHLLNVRTKDKAGNLSAIVTYKFNVGRAGLVRPSDGSRVVSRVPLQVQGESAFTHVKFAWRRGPGAAVEADIPAANLTKADGSPLGAGFVPLSSLGGSATWNAADTLGLAAGVVQVKAIMATDAAGAGAYGTVWRTVTVDPSAEGAETEGIADGSLNLQTGDFSLSTTDAQEFGLSVSRTASSRDPRAGYQLQHQRLTANQQKVSTDTTGFNSYTALVARATDRGHDSTDSVVLTPQASGPWGGDTYAAVGDDLGGGLRLGMRAGRTYRLSGWIYVPGATGLTAADERGLRIVGYVKQADGNYVPTMSEQPKLTDAWVQLSVDMAVPAGATEAFVRLYNGMPIGSGKQVYFDDLSVREITAPFGPQWKTGTSADSAEIDYTRLDFPQENTVQVELVSGSKVWFTKAASGAYFPEPGAEDLTLTMEGANYRLTETDGTVTLFSQATAGGPFLVASTTPPAQASTTRYAYESIEDQVRIKRAIAPLEPGVGDCTTPTPARGCEVLEYDYAATTTATSTAVGDFAGQVRAVSAWTTNPDNGASEKVEVVRYAYDDAGRLREVWDPRLSPPLKTLYAYDTAGRVIRVDATGDLPWFYDYGKVGADTNEGRLLKVRRQTLRQGTADVVDGEIATTVVYNVPLTRGAGGPYDLDGAAVAAWSQADVATDATAIFGPEDPVSTHNASASAPGADGYRAATVHYLNAAGKEVNTATPGGDIDTNEFDRFGNTVRVLEASNRALALGLTPGADAKLAELGLAQYDTKTRAIWLDGQTTYSADGLDMVTSLSPIQRIALDGDPANLVNARAHTANTYDDGKPDGTAYHLMTTERTSAQVVGMSGEQDVKVTKSFYDPQIGGVSGWGIRQTTKVVLDAEAPAGSLGSAGTAVRYDAQGRARESRKLDSNGTDAGTTLSVFYTAGANSEDASCGNRPEWAGQPCVTKLAGAITGHDASRMAGDLSVKRVESYNRFGEADRIVETAAGKTRTTVTTYDGADRIKSVQITGDVGTPVQTISTTYDPNTGDALTTSFADGTSVSRQFDKLGRMTRYVDADGAWTASEFDRFGKPVKVTDSLGTTQTFGYDRAAEPRGLLTSMTDSVAGTISVKYGPDGQIVEQGLPGGVKLAISMDPTGTPVARTYTRASDSTLIAASSNVANIRGQVIQQNGPASSKTFTYDRWGRLTTAKQVSSASGNCTVRSYTYDRRSNRTGKSTRGGSSTTCPGESDPAVSETHTYDSADRITDAGYVYDAFGRITSTPSGVTNSYYTNDLVAGQETADSRMSWTLDPTLRFRQFTAEKKVNGAWANAVTKVNHYGADGDDPRWIAEDVTQSNNVTRNVEGPDGDLAVTTGLAGDATLQMISLHGDVMATVPVDSAAGTMTGAVTVRDTDEFGMPSAETPASATARYGWLGGKQRSAEALGGVVLMGARLYDPATGRFWQQDPEPGGNATPYDYCGGDPVNCTDLDGRWGWFKKTFTAVANVVAKVAEVASYIPGPIGSIAAGVSAVAYASTGNWRKAGEMALTAAANLVGAGAIVKIGARVIKAAAKTAPKAAARSAKATRSVASGARRVVGRGCNSFTPDTLVRMADGSAVPIDTIGIGDLVAATDPVTGLTVSQPVVDVFVGYGDKHLVEISLEDDETPIAATANHPIWTPDRGWVEAGSLKVGDQVRTSTGKLIAVQDIHDRGVQTGQLVLNLNVSLVHTFTVVSGNAEAVTHNASQTCPIGKSKWLTKARSYKEKWAPKMFKSRKDALAAARSDAKVMGRCRVRDVCASGNHVHLDVLNKRGQRVLTMHYRFKRRK